MASVYQINKGVSRPISFKGVKGIYIGYLAGGMVALLLLFVGLYLLRVNLYAIVVLVFGLGSVLVWSTFYLSHRFGEHGLGKFFAKRAVPNCIIFRSRRLFTGLKGGLHGS